MTGKEKILIGFAFLAPLLSASYFYSETKRVPASLVKSCDATAYEKERLQVLGLVRERIDAIKAGEDLPLLLPVEFIFSTGDRKVLGSQLSETNSILKINDDGETIIQTSDKNLSYLADHRFAREEFMKGKKKYFSIVVVKDFKMEMGSIRADSVLRNVIYDYVTHFELTGELNTAYVILADIRNPIAPHLKNVPFMKVLKNEEEMHRALSQVYVGIPSMIDRFSCETFSSILTTSFRISKGRELHAEILHEP